MAGGYNFLKTLLLLFGLFHAGSSQVLMTFAEIIRDNCALDQGQENLSCVNQLDRGRGTCFDQNMLCDGLELCPGGEDEGNGDQFNSIECRPVGNPSISTSVFDCGANFEIALNLICDGVDNCVAGGGATRSGSDEITGICDNKCLEPYYGSCNTERRCETSRLGVNCGDCFQGVDLPGQAACGTLMVGSASFEEGAAGTMPAQVCATLMYNVLSSINGFSTPATVTFTPVGAGGAAQGSDFQQLTTSLTFTNPTGTTGPVTMEECIMFNVVNDNFAESPESFTVTVTLTQAVASSPVSSASGTVTITDVDAPVFGFTQPSYSEVESINGVAGVLSAQVIITNGVAVPPGTTIVVSCTPSFTGSAAFSDFSAVTDMLPFTSGISSLPCEIPLTEDPIIENDETFQLSLSVNAAQGSLSTTAANPSIATATIIDDVPNFEFDPTAYMESESPSRTASVTIVESNGQTFAAGVSRSVFVNSQAITATGVATATSPNGDYVNVFNEAVTLTTTSTPFGYQLIDDSILEGTETFQFSLTANAAGGPVTVSPPGSGGVATVSIIEDDLTFFQFTMNPFQAAEGLLTPTVDVCVQLTMGSPPMAITLTLDPTPNSASSGDFQDVNMFINFPANVAVDTILCVPFGIVNDNAMESTEAFTVTATGGMFVNGQTSTQVNIADDDNAQFSLTTSTNSEAVTPGTATVTLSGAVLQSPISIQVSALSGSATGSPMSGVGDFMTTTSFLMFNAGDGPGTVQTFNVPIVNDTLVEGQEDIDITATIIGGSGSFIGGGTTATGAINIIDDDQIVVGFQLQSYSMFEDQGDQTVCLTVISGMLAPGISVMANLATLTGNNPNFAFATPGAAAGGGSDFNPIPSPAQVTFSAGNTIQCVTLDIFPDNFDEPDEHFLIQATGIGNQISIPDQTSDVIIGDDDLLIFRFNMTRYTVNEGGPPVQICVDLVEGVVGAGETINVASVGGTAIVPDDFNTINQGVFFPSGTVPASASAQQCFFFSPTPDLCIEDQEDIIVQLSSTNPDVQFTAAGNQAGIYINDDDTLPVTIVPPVGSTVPNFNVGESGGFVEVCVQALGNPGVLKREVVVTFSTQDGTAVGTGIGVAADFCSENFVITFEPGTAGSVVCNNISINDDDICEGNEDFNLVLASGPDGGSSISNSPGMVFIIDDDVAEITATNFTSIPENAGMVNIPIILLGQKAPGRQCVVIASTMDDSAFGGPSSGLGDFVTSTQSVTLDASMQVSSIGIELTDDGMCEGNERFEVTLSTNTPGCAIQAGLSPIVVEIVDDEIGNALGDDPHFSIVLPSGKLLCYTVQGEHGFSFNLISNKKMTMNARFVPDSRRSEVTWIGSMGIIVRDNMYKQANATALRFEAKEKKIYIGDKVELAAKNIDRMIFKNGKLTISEAPHSEGFKYPSIYVDLQDVEITFTMKFMSEHLDIFWHRTGGKIPDSHGLIGQFFRTGVVVDDVRKILIMPNKEPVPVMRRPVWSFMEREKTDDQLCWTAMNPGYQGEGLIDGTYYDYLVDDVMTSDFQFKKQ